MAIYSEFSHQKWWFSIATLNYQRVQSNFMVSRIPSICRLVVVRRTLQRWWVDNGVHHRTSHGPCLAVCKLFVPWRLDPCFSFHFRANNLKSKDFSPHIRISHNFPALPGKVSSCFPFQEMMSPPKVWGQTTPPAEIPLERRVAGEDNSACGATVGAQSWWWQEILRPMAVSIGTMWRLWGTKLLITLW